MTINAFFGWDFNSCESLRSNGVWHPIDFRQCLPRQPGHVATLSFSLAH